MQLQSIRARCKPGRHPALDSMEIVILPDGSALSLYVDDRTHWFPSIGTLLAAHHLEWNDVQVVDRGE